MLRTVENSPEFRPHYYKLAADVSSKRDETQMLPNHQRLKRTIRRWEQALPSGKGGPRRTSLPTLPGCRIAPPSRPAWLPAGSSSQSPIPIHIARLPHRSTRRSELRHPGEPRRTSCSDVSGRYLFLSFLTVRALVEDRKRRGTS